MDLQYLFVFYEIAKRGSISEGAKHLRITQPSLSRTVSKLEASLGVKLFKREPRGVSLTTEGHRIYERCHVIFRECEAIKRQSNDANVKLRFAASENLCLHVIPEILAQLPNFSIELTSGTAEEIISKVVSGEVDAGYCYHPAKGPGISCQMIAEIEFWLIAPRQGNKRLSLRDLKSLKLIGSIAKDYSGPYAAKSLLSQAGIPPVEATYQCNSQEAQIKMVQAGLGYSLVPWFSAQSYLRSKSTIQIHTAKKLKTPLFKITKQNNPVSAFEKMDALLKAAVEAIGS